MGGRLGAHAAARLLMQCGSAARCGFRAARAPALAWALPAIVVIELIGSTFGAPLVFSAVFYALIVALLFQRRAAFGHVCPRRARRLTGGLVVTLGVSCLWFGLPGTPAPQVPRLEADVRLVLACGGCAGISVGVAWCAARRASWRELERFGCLLGASFAWLLASGHRVQRLPVFPEDGVARGLALLVVCALLGLAATAGRWQAARLLLLLAVGICVRVVGLDVWQPDPSVRDMLPLVQAAGDALARGEPPYGFYAMQRGSVIPLTYLPGLWLLHNLPRAIGLPLRTMSLCADAAVVLSLWWVASAGVGIVRWRARCLAVGLSAAWLLSPSVQWNAIYAEPHPYWGVLALMFAATVRGHLTLAAALLGLAIATRQFAWIIAPFWLLWAYRCSGFTGAAQRLVVAGAVAIALLVPFAGADADSFWFGTLSWFTDYGSAHRSWFLTRLGFAGTFYASHLEGWLLPFEAAVAVGGFGLALRATTARELASWMAATYTLVIMLCPVLWSSFYLGCFVVIGMAVMLSAESRSGVAWSRAGLRRRLPRRYWVPLALESGTLCWLVYGFYGSASERGLVEAHAALMGQARAGDVFVDRSKVRLAFVQPPLFEARPATRVVASEFDPSFSDLGFLTAPRVGLVYRESRDRALALRLERAGAPIDQGRAGKYRWLLVQPAPVVAQLLPGFSGGTFRTNGKRLPLESDGARLAPRLPSAIDVREASCLVAGRSRRMLFAHPSDEGQLELDFAVPAHARRLVLFAGFDDRIVLWGRAEAKVALVFGNTARGELLVRNLPGVQWQVFAPLPPGAERIKLVVTTPDDRQRWLCIDGAWS